MQEHKTQECFSLADLKQLLKEPSGGPLTIIDVRSPDEYAEKHIPGAINIPLGELENRSNELSKDIALITACGKGGGRSAQAAALLQQMGFTNAKYLCGGTFGWYEEETA